MSCLEVRITDDGTRFLFPITDCDDNIIPLDNAITKQVTFVKPDGTHFIAPCDFYTDGLDGVLEYVTAQDEIDQLSDWEVMAYVTTVDGQWHSEIQKFKVTRILPTTP